VDVSQEINSKALLRRHWNDLQINGHRVSGKDSQIAQTVRLPTSSSSTDATSRNCAGNFVLSKSIKLKTKNIFFYKLNISHENVIIYLIYLLIKIKAYLCVTDR
jgi:hypothetical protein